MELNKKTKISNLVKEYLQGALFSLFNKLQKSTNLDLKTRL